MDDIEDRKQSRRNKAITIGIGVAIAVLTIMAQALKNMNLI